MTAVPDPAAPGPYLVGATRRTLTRASSTTGLPRELDVVIWYPATTAAAAVSPDPVVLGALDVPPERAGGPYPVIMYSPGIGGVATNSSFLNAHLASHGFVAIALSNPGTTPAPCPVSPCAGNPASLDWRNESYANRPDDVWFTLDQALAWSGGGDPLLAALLDPSRLGMIGWSAGGVTPFQVVTQDSRFRAALAMAPPSQQMGRDAAPEIAVPMMILGGFMDELALFTQQVTLFAGLSPALPER
jgi:predicted dienelactone hydrolase